MVDRVSKFKIDDDVPLPEKSGVGRPKEYPIDKLQPGQSFFVPMEKNDRTTAYSVRNAVANFKRFKTDMKLTCRVVEGGMRVWRIS